MQAPHPGHALNVQRSMHRRKIDLLLRQNGPIPITMSELNNCRPLKLRYLL